MCADVILRGAPESARARNVTTILSLGLLTCHDTTCGRDASDRAHDAATTWKRNAHAGRHVGVAA